MSHFTDRLQKFRNDTIAQSSKTSKMIVLGVFISPYKTYNEIFSCKIKIKNLKLMLGIHYMFTI